MAAAAHEKCGSGATVEDLTTGWLNDRAATVRANRRTPSAWNDGFFRGTSVKADDDLRVAYWTGKEIGARQPLEYLAEGRQVINYNDEFLLLRPRAAADLRLPDRAANLRALDPARDPGHRGGRRPVRRPDPRRLLRRLGRIPGAQTQAQVADGIRLPLAATVQKLWDPDAPELSWARFKALAEKVG
ncbi:Beta-N-acetylhexosaminidase OS=Streptomyces fumanus OX=67302 GN=GCM10018772_42830 PE=3 SV=1 [Streptomyces fumanus]